jgi:malate dehydrogenase (oxaloacetate-decarboxylating)(NADP+)
MKRGAFRPVGNDNKIVRLITNRAKMDPKKKSLYLQEADHLDVPKSSQIVLEEGIGQPILLGNMEIVELKKVGFETEVEIIITKLMRETEDEIDLQIRIGKPEKRHLLLDAQN